MWWIWMHDKSIALIGKCEKAQIMKCSELILKCKTSSLKWLTISQLCAWLVNCSLQSNLLFKFKKGDYYIQHIRIILQVYMRKPTIAQRNQSLSASSVILLPTSTSGWQITLGLYILSTKTRSFCALCAARSLALGRDWQCTKKVSKSTGE